MAQNNMSEMLQSLLSALNNENGDGRDARGAPFADGDAEYTEGGHFSTGSDSGSARSGTGGGPGGGFDFGSFFENIDFDMLMKAGELFSRYNNPDKNTELLRALKPHLREENKEKIDTAIKIVKITALLPFLRESGLFDKMF
ncbi:MAG: hypothetical protein FWE74_10035 [Oscillospiraceae bacterium]|nr:hypothetical protein [Oscillospiraceae bacterium]